MGEAGTSVHLGVNGAASVQSSVGVLKRLHPGLLCKPASPRQHVCSEPLKPEVL